jgi:branched-chain amino acid aminotransferase
MSRISALFETVLVRSGIAIRLDEHLGRLLRSAKTIGLPVYADPAEVRRRCRDLPDGRLRLKLEDGHVEVSVTPFPGYQEEMYREGAVALISVTRGHPLGDLAGHKSLPYDIMIKARERALEQGADEVLHTDTDGALLEGTVSNLFVVIGGVLKTPPLTRPILPGITRATVLALAAGMGLETSESDVFSADLEAADEAFLTSSLMLAMPLRKLGDTALRPGPVAAGLRLRLLG